MSLSYRYVLVTGATGFVGAHVVDHLLERGIKVRAVFRSKSKADRMLKARPQYADKLDFYFIDDLCSPGAFDNAVKDIDGVVHCASPLIFDVKDREKEILIPAIRGVVSILEASAKSGTVKRVVLTSSFGAIMHPEKDKTVPNTYTSKDWTPVTYEQATDPTLHGTVAYRGSKKFAEQAAWKFMEEEKPSFDLVTLCPSMIFGPIVSPCDKPSEMSGSCEALWQTVSAGGELDVLPTDFWIDVRDLAEMHVLALTTPAASNKRYLPVAPEKFTYQIAADIVRKEFPEWPAERIGTGSQQVNNLCQVDVAEVRRDFPSIKYTSFHDTVVDFIKQIIALEKASKA